MIVTRTRWTAKNILKTYLYFSVFEVLLIVTAFAIGTSLLPSVCAYFLGWCWAAVSVPMLPYALLTTVRQYRDQDYVTLALAVLATVTAVLAILGGTIVRIFQMAMAGTAGF